MCFQLYAGTDKPLPRSSWNQEEPLVHICDLSESDVWIRPFFTKPEVQYVGSTTSCGCAFPSVRPDRDGYWPTGFDLGLTAEESAESQKECTELCQLLSVADDESIELYGVWNGEQTNAPLVREEITLADIRAKLFFFKEGGFYVVRMH